MIACFSLLREHFTLFLRLEYTSRVSVQHRTGSFPEFEDLKKGSLSFLDGAIVVLRRTFWPVLVALLALGSPENVT